MLLRLKWPTKWGQTRVVVSSSLLLFLVVVVVVRSVLLSFYAILVDVKQ